MSLLESNGFTLYTFYVLYGSVLCYGLAYVWTVASVYRCLLNEPEQCDNWIMKQIPTMANDNNNRKKYAMIKHMNERFEPQSEWLREKERKMRLQKKAGYNNNINMNKNDVNNRKIL